MKTILVLGKLKLTSSSYIEHREKLKFYNYHLVNKKFMHVLEVSSLPIIMFELWAFLDMFFIYLYIEFNTILSFFYSLKKSYVGLKASKL